MNNIKKIMREYAWIEFSPEGSRPDTIEYRLYINWFGTIYCKIVEFTDLIDVDSTIINFGIDLTIKAFITHLEKL